MCAAVSWFVFLSFLKPECVKVALNKYFFWFSMFQIKEMIFVDKSTIFFSHTLLKILLLKLQFF